MISNARHTGLTIIITALLFGAIPGVSPASAQSPPPEPAGAEAAPINALCPVTTDEVVDPRFTAIFKGQTIGLCCKKCLRKFNEDPEAYVANLPQFQTVALTQASDDHADPVVDDHDDHEHTNADTDHDDAEAAGHDDEAHEHDHGAVVAAEHDHTRDHDDGKRLRIFTWLGKLHPPATDMPIAMLIGAALAEGLFMVSRREMFRNAAVFCVLIAAAGALVAAPLGWFNAGFVLVDDDWVQTTHRWLGTSTALLTLITLGLLIGCAKSGKPAATLRYRVALFATAGLVGVTGFFGGALVYGINHYAW